MSSYPKKSKAFGQWAKLMQEQATVPDRVDYKGKKRAVKGGKKPSRLRRKRFRSRKRRTSD